MASDCPICDGSGWLIKNVDTCPLCEDGDGESGEDEDGDEGGKKAQDGGRSDERPGRGGWELLLDSGWERLQPELEALLDEAEDAGRSTVKFARGPHAYEVDLDQMVQVNRRTMTARRLRRAAGPADPAGDVGHSSGSAKGHGKGLGFGKGFGFKGKKGRDSSDPSATRQTKEERAIARLPCRSERLSRLVDRLLSPDVQVLLPVDCGEEPCRLSPEEVEAVFVKHVPGVREFLYRGQYGQYSLEFIKNGYREGFRAFQGTDMHEHLLWLLRLVVHHGHAGGSDTKRHLTDVAEAFMDCQAVQARVVERVGLQIRGVAPNFKGLVTAMIGDCKTIALKMLAATRLEIGLASDDDVPTHYENRLTADLGDLTGLNQDDVRRAKLDEHADARFRRLTRAEAERAVVHLRGLFDLDALVQAFVAEVNSFSQDSAASSLARLFLDWACKRLGGEAHVVFDEDTSMSVEVGEPLALAVIEVLFLGETAAPADELYRGRGLRSLFAQPAAEPQEAREPSPPPATALPQTPAEGACARAGEASPGAIPTEGRGLDRRCGPWGCGPTGVP